ncbi:MAG: Ribose import permease protein RbsC [Firmicutes bacterium]|nr:Ribose import permease protein RbsC [Bacillota bacterium]
MNLILYDRGFPQKSEDFCGALYVCDQVRTMSRKTQLMMLLMDNLIWVMVAAFFVINALITPRFATYGNIINVLYHSSILSMLVLGQGIVLLSGHLDLSLDATLAFSAGMAMLLATRWMPGLDPVTSIAVTLAVGAGVGLFNGLFIAKIGVNPFLQTLAMLIILRGVLLFMLPVSIAGLDPIYTFAGRARVVGEIPVAVFLMVAIFVLFHFVLKGTHFGRLFTATGGNPRASFISGINTTRMTISAFVMSGLLAGVAGLLAAGRQNAVTAPMGEGMILMSFAGAILGGASLRGGRGAPLGMLGGALLLGMFSNALTLQGVSFFLVRISWGALILLALVLDRVKERARTQLLLREQISRLKGVSSDFSLETS